MQFVNIEYMIWLINYMIKLDLKWKVWYAYTSLTYTVGEVQWRSGEIVKEQCTWCSCIHCHNTLHHENGEGRLFIPQNLSIDFGSTQVYIPSEFYMQLLSVH